MGAEFGGLRGGGGALPGRYLAACIGAVVVGRRIGLVSTLLDTFEQAGNPQRLFLRRHRQQQHVPGAARIMIEFARRQQIILIHMLLVDLVAASEWECSVHYQLFVFLFVFHCLPLAFVRRRRLEQLPQWLGAYLAGRRHVIRDVHELVP